jgi:hypothetical protein
MDLTNWRHVAVSVTDAGSAELFIDGTPVNTWSPITRLVIDEVQFSHLLGTEVTVSSESGVQKANHFTGFIY